ncbi:hypothetical protein FOZ63_033798 [Perkinsus olseni]|uniref:Uncharacterized protein n=1 Tax=Perkinsus olseni TaxID=32597 RepID=A0A7J6QNK7_PEROL|nr:hypothetical protein FOZ63_033798 [Perkinsus olseni]
MSIPLSPNSTYSVGVLWDFVGGQPIDVDIQAIAVDNRALARAAVLQFASSAAHSRVQTRHVAVTPFL